MVHGRIDKESLSAERKARLDSLGFVWNPIEQQWEEGYEALKTYQSTHGHCRVPSGYKTEDRNSLGTWTHRQRRIKESLSAERKARLDSLGFVWNPIEQQWEEGYEALKTYQSTHGHCLVPAKYKTEMAYSLGNWVGVQRRAKNALSAECKARLEALGFVWNRLEQQWEEGYEALKAYQAIYGHCHVPWKYETDTGYSLGGWVIRQRTQKDSMPTELKRRLDALGFVWNLLEKQWEEGYEVLKTYQSIHSHCRVPAKYKTEEGYKLGVWVGTQRMSKEALSIDNKDSLNALGFVWDPHKQQWEKGYEALKMYQSIHGHCVVPGSHKTETGARLGGWVSKQRQLKGSLSAECKARLDVLGFVWDVIEQQWEEGCEALTAYQLTQGHCRVPFGYKTETGVSLGTWVSNQRRSKDSLSAERKERLDALGFIWSAGK